MDERRKLGNNIFWNSFGTLFYLGCQWLTSVLVVRLTGDYADAGILSLAMSICSPLTVLAMLNLRTVQVADSDMRFRDTDYIHTRIITSVFAFFLCALFVLLQDYDPYTSACILIFMLFRISEAVVDVFHGIDQKFWRLDIAGKSFILRGIMVLFGVIVGEYFFKSILLTIVSMTIGVYLIILFYDIPESKRLIPMSGKFNRSRALGIVKIGIPLGSFAVLLNTMSSIPRVFLEYWHGTELLGVFGSIANITVLVPQMASFIFSPLIKVFAEKRQNNDKVGFCHVLTVCVLFTALIGLAAIIIGYFLGEQVLVLLIGESIRPYCNLFVPVLFSMVLLAFVWLLSSVLVVLGDYSPLAILTVLATAICIGASILLIKDGVLWGTIKALVIAMAVECVLLSFRMWYTVRKSF